MTLFPKRALTTAIVLTGTLLAIGALAQASTLDSQHPEPWPGHEDVQDALFEAEEHEWVTLHKVGESVEGREIRVAEVTDNSSSVPLEDRPRTLLLTQQHGNEPAGTPAALDLLEDITTGAPIADTLENQVLLLLPMANPDGSETFSRQNADGVDTNRDHITLETPEARAMHEVLNRWDVDVALDHHEYGGTGPGNPVPVRTYDYDLLTLFPRHGNVPHPAVEAAQDLMYEAIWPAAEEEGYSVNEYGEMTVAGEPVDRIAGGPDPGIARNHYGLHNAASILVETRIDQHPNPAHDEQRRIDAQSVVMEATLEHVHENADWFRANKEASEHLAETAPHDTYREGNTEAPFADGYLFEDDETVKETFHAHGMDPGTLTEKGIVHETGHVLHGHAGALVHPDSSRSITNGAPLDASDIQDTVGEDGDALEAAQAEETPIGVGPLVAGLVGALALARWTRC